MEDPAEDFYAGLVSLVLTDSPIDLGDGLLLRKAYARFLTPLILANTGNKTTSAGVARPSNWKLSPPSGRNTEIQSKEIFAELVVPASCAATFQKQLELVRLIVFLIRLWSNPAVILQVLSSHPFSTLADAMDGQTPSIRPLEIQPRYFSLGLIDESKVVESLAWVQSNWKTAHALYVSSAEFKLALDALASGQFVPNTALTMVLLWGALEAIFSPTTVELRFRVSALIAAYLEPPGQKRLERQKEVASLYDKRSAAAHGHPKHQDEDLLKTFELLRKVIIKIIHSKKVPTKEELHALLFGASV